MPPADETLTAELTALHLEMKRAVSCALDKIIEPDIDDDLRDCVRMDLEIAARLAGVVKIALASKADDVKRRSLADNVVACRAKWIAVGGLRWMGDPDDLRREHFSARQH